jgi:hypothetical protein
MAERRLCGSRYRLALGPPLCAILNQRLRLERRYPKGSWRVDETYVRVARNWGYL